MIERKIGLSDGTPATTQSSFGKFQETWHYTFTAPLMVRMQGCAHVSGIRVSLRGACGDAKLRVPSTLRPAQAGHRCTASLRAQEVPNQLIG